MGRKEERGGSFLPFVSWEISQKEMNGGAETGLGLVEGERKHFNFRNWREGEGKEAKLLVGRKKKLSSYSSSPQNERSQRSKKSHQRNPGKISE